MKRKRDILKNYAEGLVFEDDSSFLSTLRSIETILSKNNVNAKFNFKAHDSNTADIIEINNTNELQDLEDEMEILNIRFSNWGDYEREFEFELNFKFEYDSATEIRISATDENIRNASFISEEIDQVLRNKKSKILWLFPKIELGSTLHSAIKIMIWISVCFCCLIFLGWKIFSPIDINAILPFAVSIFIIICASSIIAPMWLSSVFPYIILNGKKFRDKKYKARKLLISSLKWFCGIALAFILKSFLASIVSKK